jgi:hypothetical protein
VEALLLFDLPIDNMKDNKETIECHECQPPHSVPLADYTKHVEAERLREFYCSECDQPFKKFLLDIHKCRPCQWLTLNERDRIKETKDDRPLSLTYHPKWEGMMNCSHPSKTHVPPLAYESRADGMTWWILIAIMLCFSPDRIHAIQAWTSFGLGWILFFRYNINGDRCVDCHQIRSLALNCSSCARTHCWWCSWKTMQQHILDWGYAHYDCATTCTTQHWLPRAPKQGPERRSEERKHAEIDWNRILPVKLPGKPGLAPHHRFALGIKGLVCFVWFLYSCFQMAKN